MIYKGGLLDVAWPRPVRRKGPISYEMWMLSGNHDPEHTANLGVDRIRDAEQHRNLFNGFPVKGNLELIPG